MAVLSSIVPYTLELLALRRLPTATFAVLMSLGPAIAALAGYLVLGQHLTVTEVPGQRARHRRQHRRGAGRSAAPGEVSRGHGGEFGVDGAR